MMKTRRTTSALACSCAVSAISLFLAAVALAAERSEEEHEKEQPGRDAPACELRIEGKLVQRLTLVNKQGQARQIDDPGPSVRLPADQYRVQAVDLHGGYSGYLYSATDYDSFVLSPDRPCHLQVGAPLTPNVKARREGRLLRLDYKLLDAGGRNYSDRTRAKPPRFTVYQGDREIASGSFEYG